MATRFLTRSLVTTKQTLASVISRSYASLPLSTPPSSSFSLLRLRLRPVIAVDANVSHVLPATITVRGFATRQSTSSLKDTSPNWSNRPPKETILLEGCDFEHWLVVMEKPEGEPTRDEIIDSYIKTLAMVVGSEEEARMKLYSVSTRCYYAFGALVSEEVSYKIKELPKVRWVLPDSYLYVKTKDYGGEPFINGQAVPYDPKYHEDWMRNHEKANNPRNRDRPRNFDRSRNFERRRENMQNQMGNRGMQNPGPNMGWPAPSNVGGAPNMGRVPPSNMGGMQQGNTGVGPNYGVTQPNNMGGQPPNYMGGSPKMGGMSPNNMGGVPQNTPNFQHRNGPNNGVVPYQSGPGPNREYPQNNWAPNMAGGNPYQTQDMPGRDVPPPPNYQ